MPTRCGNASSYASSASMTALAPLARAQPHRSSRFCVCALVPPQATMHVPLHSRAGTLADKAAMLRAFEQASPVTISAAELHVGRLCTTGICPLALTYAGTCGLGIWTRLTDRMCVLSRLMPAEAAATCPAGCRPASCRLARPLPPSRASADGRQAGAWRHAGIAVQLV